MNAADVAAIIYGAPRLTNDIDIVLALSGREARRLSELFDPAAFYLPPAEAIEAERLRPWHGHFNVAIIRTLATSSTSRNFSQRRSNSDSVPSGVSSIARWRMPPHVSEVS